MTKYIKILVTNDALIAAVANAEEIFLKVNEFLQESGRPPLFDVKLVATSKEMVIRNGHFKVQIDENIQEVHCCDLLIIPPPKHILNTEVDGHLIAWIENLYQNGADVAGISDGVFLLAETGLLSNGTCFVPPTHQFAFQSHFPDIKLVEGNSITEYKGVYTGGDSNCYWNILAYLAQKYIDKKTAELTYVYFERNFGNQFQAPLLVFDGNKEHKDEVIIKVQEYIENNYQEKLTIQMLSQYAAMTNRTLQRRFKKATRLTILYYIQKTKIEISKKLLEQNHLSINEVMNEVGYQDPKAFRELFKKISGMSPSEYKRKYGLRKNEVLTYL